MFTEEEALVDVAASSVKDEEAIKTPKQSSAPYMPPTPFEFLSDRKTKQGGTTYRRGLQVSVQVRTVTRHHVTVASSPSPPCPAASPSQNQCLSVAFKIIFHPPILSLVLFPVYYLPLIYIIADGFFLARPFIPLLLVQCRHSTFNTYFILVWVILPLLPPATPFFFVMNQVSSVHV